MKYCSACGQFLGASESVAPGAALVESPLSPLQCPRCRTLHYLNPKVLVSCIAYYGQRIVMCRRALEPSQGRWTVPAGYMEQGETIEGAAVRETAEEVGIELDPDALELYAILSLPAMNQVYVTLRTELLESPQLRCGPESLEAALVGEQDLTDDQWAFAGTLVKTNAAVLFQEIRTRQFGIHKMLLRGRGVPAGDLTAAAAPVGAGEIRTYWLLDGKPDRVIL